MGTHIWLKKEVKVFCSKSLKYRQVIGYNSASLLIVFSHATLVTLLPWQRSANVCEDLSVPLCSHCASMQPTYLQAAVASWTGEKVLAFSTHFQIGLHTHGLRYICTQIDIQWHNSPHILANHFATVMAQYFSPHPWVWQLRTYINHASIKRTDPGADTGVSG